MEADLKKLFKIKSKQMFQQTRNIFEFLILGIKSVWLIDSIRCKLNDICQFLDKYGLSDKLCVIEIDEDLLIANKEVLFSCVIFREIKSLIFFDISPRLEAPLVIQNGTPEMCEIESQISHVKSIIIGTDFSKRNVITIKDYVINIDRCLIYGWLLSYPSIYFNSDHKANLEGNCLNYIQLQAWQISAKTINSSVIYSFSIPQKSILNSEAVKLKLDIWICSIQERAASLGVCLTVNYKLVCLPIVAV